mgnify:CR=1 FL=1
MRRITRLMAAGFAAILFSTSVSASGDVSLGERAALQAAMQQYVDHKTVDGAYLLFDMQTAEVRELYPVTGHPIVMQLDEHFVLCFDFADAKGRKVEVDYYLARKDNGFVVFHEAVGSRKILEAMMKRGRVKPVN